MQALGENGVVAKERMPQENVSMPRQVQDALAGMWERLGVKSKWMAYSAAILAFYRMTEEEQYAAMDAVVAARRRNDFRHLLLPDMGDGEPTSPDRPPGPVAKVVGRTETPKPARRAVAAQKRKRSH